MVTTYKGSNTDDHKEASCPRESGERESKGTQVIGFGFLTLLKYLIQFVAEGLARGLGNRFELRENPSGSMKQAVAYSSFRKE